MENGTENSSINVSLANLACDQVSGKIYIYISDRHMKKTLEKSEEYSVFHRHKLR